MIRSVGRAIWYAVTAFILLAVAFGSAAAAAQTPPATPLTRGFADDVWFAGSPAANAQWVSRTVATGATRVVIEVDWTSIEPTQPTAPNDPTSPSDPQYRFSILDGRVREFVGTGLTPVFLVTDAPRWAEESGGPGALEADGAWSPNATAFGQFATALAARYSGSYPDPLNPTITLPRVQYFQAWAEANLSVHLAPQWTKSGDDFVSSGPAIYRSLLNAFYAGVKAVHPDNVVITTGLGPYGDPPSLSRSARTPPAEFLRQLLCLKGRVELQPQSCPQPAHFDAYAADPYEVGSPTTPAINPDDVSAPDLWKLTRIVRKALSVGLALPNTDKQLWVTEFSYDSNPPNPTAVSLATQARWLEQGFFVFWRQGADTVVWQLVRDQAGHNYRTSYFSGVYFFDGTPKPSFEAYRFPLVVMKDDDSTVVWGISPQTGTLAVERLVKGTWKVLFELPAVAGSVFVRSIPSSLHGSFRAVVDGETSLTWVRGDDPSSTDRHRTAGHRRPR